MHHFPLHVTQEDWRTLKDIVHILHVYYKYITTVFSSHTHAQIHKPHASPKHVPLPINVDHFPIHITQEDCRTQSWTQGVLTLAFTCMLCIEGTWCRYVHGWLATRILSQKREPWELDSCGLHWNKKKDQDEWLTIARATTHRPTPILYCKRLTWRAWEQG